MNLQSKFGNCIITKTLMIELCKREGITDGRIDRQADGQTVTYDFIVLCI